MSCIFFSFLYQIILLGLSFVLLYKKTLVWVSYLADDTRDVHVVLDSLLADQLSAKKKLYCHRDRTIYILSTL